MTTFDLSPLYRSTVGFERLANLLAGASRVDNSSAFPPYNIEVVDEDEYRITMAVAGFGDEDLSITSEQNRLTVSGRKEGQEEERQYLYRGIAERTFERRFQLADHVKVTGARLENGLLHINLVRELPEAMKPQNIRIEGSTGKKSGKLLEGGREAA